MHRLYTDVQYFLLKMPFTANNVYFPSICGGGGPEKSIPSNLKMLSLKTVKKLLFEKGCSLVTDREVFGQKTATKL